MNVHTEIAQMLQAIRQQPPDWRRDRIANWPKDALLTEARKIAGRDWWSKIELTDPRTGKPMKLFVRDDVEEEQRQYGDPEKRELRDPTKHAPGNYSASADPDPAIEADDEKDLPKSREGIVAHFMGMLADALKRRPRRRQFARERQFARDAAPSRRCHCRMKLFRGRDGQIHGCCV